MFTTNTKPNMALKANHSNLVSGRLTGIPCHLNVFIVAILAYKVEPASVNLTLAALQQLCLLLPRNPILL
jgi:hypothetical protein